MANSVNGDIRLRVDFDTSPTEKSAGRVENRLQQMGGTLSSAFGKAAKEQTVLANKLESQYAKLERLTKKQQLMEMGGARGIQMQRQFSEQIAEVDRLKTKMTELKAKRDDLLTRPGREMTRFDNENLQTYTNLLYEANVKLREAQDSARNLKHELNRIREAQIETSQYQNLTQDINTARENIGGLEQEMVQAAQSSSGEFELLGYILSRLGITGVEAGAMTGQTWLAIGAAILALFGKVGDSINKFFSNIFDGGKQTESIFDKIGKSIDRIGRQIRYAFVTSVMRKALNELKSYLEGLISLDAQLVSSLRQIKGNLQTAFTPIFQAILPALNALASALATVTGYISALVSLLFGSSLKATQANTKANNDLAKSYGGAGGAANKASKQLLAFDEIQTITADNASGGGGGVGGVDWSSLFEFEVPDWWKKLEDMFAEGKFYEMGAFIAEQMNAWFDPNKFEQAGRNIGKWFQNAFNFALGFLRTIDTRQWGEAIARFINGIFDELNPETVGQTIGEFFNRIVDLIHGFVANIKWREIGKWLGTALKNIFLTINFIEIADTVADLVNGIVDLIYEFFTSADFPEIAQRIIDGLNRAIEKIDWKKLSTVLSMSLKGFLGLLILILRELDWGQIGKVIGEFFGSIDWEPIIAMLAIAMNTLGNAILEALWNFFIANAQTGAKRIFGYFFNILSSSVDEEGTSLMRKILNFFGDMLNNITGIFDNIGEWFSEVFNDVYWGIVNALSGVGRWFQGCWDDITAVFDNTIEWFSELFNNVYWGIINALSGVGMWFSNTFNNAWLSIKNAFASVRTFFDGIWTSIKNAFSTVGSWFKGIFEGAWNGVVDTTKVAINKVIGFVNSMIGKIESGINSIIGGINSAAAAVGISGLGKVSFSRIPYLAQGTVLPGGRPFAAIVNDQPAGQTNIESPLSTIEDAVENVFNRRGNIGTDLPPIIVQLVVGEQVLAEQFVRLGNREMTRQGKGLVDV